MFNILRHLRLAALLVNQADKTWDEFSLCYICREPTEVLNDSMRDFHFNLCDKHDLSVRTFCISYPPSRSDKQWAKRHIQWVREDTKRQQFLNNEETQQ